MLEYVNDDMFSSWYVGIAQDPVECLFSRHQVDQLNGQWIHCGALDNVHARSAEKMLLELGFDGGPGGGDSTTTYVYAYKKTPTTNE